MKANPLKTIILFCAYVLLLTAVDRPANGQTATPVREKYATAENIAYRDSDDDASDIQKACQLDVYYPTDVKNFATVVWFHGGGLTGGKRAVPQELRDQGIAVVAVSYRLSPAVKVTTCIDDAAAAVAWTFRNIAEYGGAQDRIFVSGHSAGGYLTSMIGLDKHWLAAHEIDADHIAGLIPFSGHTITQFTVRKEQGIDGYNHGQMAGPAHPLLLRFINRVSKD